MPIYIHACANKKIMLKRHVEVCMRVCNEPQIGSILPPEMVSVDPIQPRFDGQCGCGGTG